MSYNVHTEFVANMQLSMTSKSFTLEIIVVAKLEKQSVLTTLERPPEEEKELHEYISAFMYMQLPHSYLYWDVFKRQKTEDKLSKKKKNRAKILTAALQTSFLGPRRKHLSQYMDPSIKHRLQTTSASTKVLDNGQVNLLTYKTTAVQ